MTCIVGFTDGTKVVIGGDSAGVAGLDLTIRADQKVFKNGPAVMGFTSSFRMGQLLRYSFSVPKRHADVDLDAYMVTTFIDAVRSCLKAGGYATTDDGAERGGTFLVGIEGRLFQINSDYQVGESVQPFDAVGCGEAYALGAMHAIRNVSPIAYTPTQLVRAGLEAAEAYSAGVRGPFHFIST